MSYTERMFSFLNNGTEVLLEFEGKKIKYLQQMKLRMDVYVFAQTKLP